MYVSLSPCSSSPAGPLFHWNHWKCSMFFGRIPCSYSLACHSVLPRESWGGIVNILSVWVKGFSLSMLNLTWPCDSGKQWWLKKCPIFIFWETAHYKDPPFPVWFRWLRMLPCLPMTRPDTGSPYSHSLPPKWVAELLQSTDQSGQRTYVLDLATIYLSFSPATRSWNVGLSPHMTPL